MSDDSFVELAEIVGRRLTGLSALTVRLEECGADGTCSRTSTGETVIRIRPSLDDEWRVKVLLHELGHAVLHWPIMDAFSSKASKPFVDPVIEKQAQEQADLWFKAAKDVAFKHFAETGNNNPCTAEFYETILRGATYI